MSDTDNSKATMLYSKLETTNWREVVNRIKRHFLIPCNNAAYYGISAIVVSFDHKI